ncbi:ATP-dependent RNA helicase DBP2-A-like [Ischnura elegans]|uniref:ATP-dependent RNA helicase DBP2-A-like n=1 Tax=Ischnura elegans TaxID=197161 RepID=UPI001ED89BE9|nr:ATP-dependent RNA helicase DBP2-A-like [Ischnura elegans]
MKTAVVLCLAMVAMASSVPYEKNLPVQTFRIGYVSPSYIVVKGIISPSTSDLAKGFPAYDLTHYVDGAPSVETDKYFLRCSTVSDTMVPYEKADSPLFLCRTEAFNKDSDVVDVPRMAFLFSAENFDIPAGVTDFGLSIGRNFFKQNFHAVPDTTRVVRQFGGGFSGSGAQAGASSFGGGGGFGGFPGGGFGGGASGSQASAGAGSVAGGGGGGFWG